MSRIQEFVRLTALEGYRPNMSVGGPDANPNCIYRGVGFWIRAGGRLKPVKGALEISSQAVGPRIYPLDIYRGEIAGDLVSSRLPKEALVRYQQSALFFLSENTSKQVYINESTTTPFNMSGVTTSSTAGKLRVAILSGSAYTVYDAGLNAPPSIGTAAAEVGGTKSMDGRISVRSAARRISTDTTSNPTEASVFNLTASGSNRVRITLPSMASGQDGWQFSGTRWNDGNFGDWFVIRDIQTAFTVTATNGSSTITGTELSLNLKPGDRVTINGTQFYIGAGANAPTFTTAVLTSDAAGTTPTNFGGATNSYTLTINEVALEWRDGELGEPVEFDNDPPPVMDGLMLFNNVPFGWKDNMIIPSKIGNPEAFPRRLRRTTQSGANIVHALAGDARIYLMTTNGLEIVTFTQLPDDPFIIRQVWGFGFSSPAQGVVAEGSFFGAIGTERGVKIVRTRPDQSPDVEFSQDVEPDMLNWNIANVVLGFDPTDAALLAMHSETGTTTDIIPYMLHLGVWSVPHSITGQVTDCATVSNNAELMVDVGSEFHATRFEGGNGTNIDKYVAWAFMDAPQDAIRKTIKRIKVIADADELRVYRADVGDLVPDVTVAGLATSGPFTLISGLAANLIVSTNIQNCELYSIRIDSGDSDAEIDEVSVWGIMNRAWK